MNEQRKDDMSHDNFQPPDGMNTEEAAELANVLPPTSGLVGRLREACSGTNYNWQIELHNEAADEIERLRGIVPEVLERLNDELCAENAVLRSKLLDVAMMLRTCGWALRRGTSPDLGERALELLKKHDLLGSPLRA